MPSALFPILSAIRKRDVRDDGGEGYHLTDFGLAVPVEGASALTLTGMIVGTPCYMAPEQTGGRRAEIGPRTDVYALGAILYEVLTGRPPFQSETPLDTLKLVRESDPITLRRLNPRIPADLETICLKCLEKEPRRRYATALELVEDLDLSGRNRRSRTKNTFSRTHRGSARKPCFQPRGSATGPEFTTTPSAFPSRRRPGRQTISPRPTSSSTIVPPSSATGNGIT